MKLPYFVIETSHAFVSISIDHFRRYFKFFEFEQSDNFEALFFTGYYAVVLLI